jgi:hypothetical protein
LRGLSPPTSLGLELATLRPEIEPQVGVGSSPYTGQEFKRPMAPTERSGWLIVITGGAMVSAVRPPCFAPYALIALPFWTRTATAQNAVAERGGGSVGLSLRCYRRRAGGSILRTYPETVRCFLRHLRECWASSRMLGSEHPSSAVSRLRKPYPWFSPKENHTSRSL